MIVDKEHCYSHARGMGESADCTVRACAVAAQIDYPTMHEYLRKQCWRENGRGLHPYQYHAALGELGFTLTQLNGPKFKSVEYYVEGHDRYSRRSGEWAWVPGHYRRTRRRITTGDDYSSLTVKTLARELTLGTYLVAVSGHVLCLRDGVVHDWTDGRAHRVQTVIEVTQ